MNLLQGDDFALRPASEQDYELITAWNFDPVISRYFSPRPVFDEEQQKKWFKRMLVDVTKKKFMIIPHMNQQAVGLVGLQEIDLINGRAEIGISIGDKNWQGKGLGVKSVSLLMRYAFQIMGLYQLRAEVFAENEKARRLFTTCGFNENGRLRAQWKTKEGYQDVVLYSILSSEITPNEP